MKLLESIELGALKLKNRVVMAPMTRNRAENTNPGALNVVYYRQRASAGLIITEASQVDALGQGYPETPGIFTDEQVEGWKEVTDAVHAAGGQIVLQLWHVGRISHPSFHEGAKPVAPSALKPTGSVFTYEGEQPFETPRALATDEVADVVSQYRHGAEMAKKAGFDGVEIHAANGYLIDQFLQSGTNERTDRYGGSLENRARFLFEVTDAVVDVWGADRVGLRLSPGGRFNTMYDEDPAETFGYVAERLNDYGLAYLHVIREPGNVDIMRDGEVIDAFTLLRDAFDGPLMVNGGLGRDDAEALLTDGTADVASFGRPFIANPDLPLRFAEDAPLAEADPATFYGGGAEGFIDYPALEDTALQAA